MKLVEQRESREQGGGHARNSHGSGLQCSTRRFRHHAKGILLIECLVYFSIWLVVMGLAFAAFYRSLFDPGRAAARPVIVRGARIGDAVVWLDPAVQTAEAWHDAIAAVRLGIPVQSVTTWSTFGSCDWDSLLRLHRGTYRAGAFDVSQGRPVLTPLGMAVRATAAGRPPAPRPTGWWRQPYRVSFPGEPDVAA